MRQLWKKGWVSLAILSFSIVYLIHLSWLKWGDLVIDSGREMFVPLKLASGSLLYKDISYIYGPFSPYLNALLFKIFGPHLHSLIIGGIAAVSLTAVLVYKTSRLFLGVGLSTLTALFFLFVLAFSHYYYLGNYNFIVPYSYASTHAILLSLCAFYFLFRFLHTGRISFVVFSASSILLCFLCRPEMGLILFLTVAFVRLAAINTKQNILNFPLPGLLLPALMAGIIYISLWIVAGGNLQDLFAVVSNSPFSSSLAGTDLWRHNLFLVFKSLAGYAALYLLFLVAGHLIENSLKIQQRPLRYSAKLSIFVATVAVTFFFLNNIFVREFHFRALPVIYLATAGLAWYRLKQNKIIDVQTFILAVFSFLTGARMLLKMQAEHYGFFIMVPGIIVLSFVLFRLLPSYTKTKSLRISVCAGFVLFIVVSGIQHLSITRLAYSQKTQKIQTENGTLFVFAGLRELRCQQLMDYLKANIDAGASVVFIPEGITMNFLGGWDNPLINHTFLPMDLATERLEDNVVSDMRKKDVDYIVLLQRSVDEYGKKAFGIDYGTQIMSYVNSSYDLVQVFGSYPYTRNDDFGIAVFRNKRISSNQRRSQ